MALYTMTTAAETVVAGTIIAGLGCRHGVTSAAVIAAVEQATRASCLRPGWLAIPDFKRCEAGLLEAAAQLGIRLRRVGHDALRAEQPRCVTRSERVASITGVHSVAEACALALAGPAGRLVLPRIVLGGVTCAFAMRDDRA